MSVAGDPVDYINRKFDLLALRGATPVGDQLLDQTLFGPDASGEVCTGVQKLSQRWILHFLTSRGSIPFLPDRGTDFLQEAASGQFRTELDVVQSFAIAEGEARREMQNEETDEYNDEERIVRAELLQIALLGDKLSLTVEITSVAGTSRKVILPIPFLPIRTLS